MKKNFLLVAMVLVFSAPLLHAQGSGGTQSTGLPQASGPGGSIICTASVPGSVSGCCLDCCGSDCCDINCPTPTPTPLPTPTPTSTGTIGPKFVVLAVTYAPPGSQSSVTYSNSTIFGSSLGLSSSFSNTTSFSVATATNAQIFGIGGFGGISASTGFTQSTDSSLTIAVTETTARTFTVRGPSSSALGISHDADVIWIWLNPVFNFSDPSPNTLQWASAGFDNRDPAGDLDIIGIQVAFLNGHAPMPQALSDLLARGWAPRIACDPATDPECGADGTKSPGLTLADFNKILAADPFTDPSYSVQISPTSTHGCTVDERFCNATVETFEYSPPPPGQQPITETFSETRQAVATEAVGAALSVTVGFSKTFGNNTSTFLFDFLRSLTIANNLTVTNRINLSNNQQATQISSLSITGPASTDNYTGPVELNVMQDNVYGTFAFVAIPATTFSVSASPGSQSVAQSACMNYSVVIGALVSGFNKTVTLSVSGLPPGVTGTFTPASVTGGGSSTLLVCATEAAALGGPSTFTIKGTSGAEAHSTNASITITQPFTLSTTPASQSVLAGGTATYTVCVTPQNGFSGTISFSNGLLPAGVGVSFSPASLAGGCSTMTVTTSSSTPSGAFAIAITATSGTLSQATSVTLTVNPPAGGGDFTLNASPTSETVIIGDDGVFTITVTPQNGFTGTVTLSATGSSRLGFFFSPASIAVSGTSELDVATGFTGIYPITITGTSGTLSHSITVNLTVKSCGRFCL